MTHDLKKGVGTSLATSGIAQDTQAQDAAATEEALKAVRASGNLPGSMRAWSAHRRAERPVPDFRFVDGVDIEQPSYADLLDYYDAAGHLQDKQKLADFRYAVSLFCLSEQVGKDVDDSVGPEFGALQFEAVLARVQDELVTEKRLSVATAQNVATRLRALHRYYIGYMAAQDLPADFRAALCTLLLRRGLLAVDLRRLHGETAYQWAIGNCAPKRKASYDLVCRLESVLEVPKGTLTSRIRRAVAPLYSFEAVVTDDPYGRYMTVIRKRRYLLPFSDWPSSLQEAWQRYVLHKKRSEHRINRKTYRLEPWEVWHSENTVKKINIQWQMFFGFLCLPAPKSYDAWLEMSWDERLSYGMGFKPEALHIAMLLDHDLLERFMRYQQNRSYDREHWLNEEFRRKALAEGKAVPKSASLEHKTLSQTTRQFFIVCNNLINKPYSFARLHPDLFLPYFKPAPSDWEQWCNECHEKTTGEFAAWVNDLVQENKVDHKARLAPLLRDDSPASYWHEFINALSSNLSPVTSPKYRALDIQYLAILHLLSFDPLRGKNIVDLDFDRNIQFLDDGRVRLFISVAEQKNWIWGHAENRDFFLPEPVAKAMRRWAFEERPKIKGQDQTNAVFLRITQGGGRRTKNTEDPYRLSRIRLTQYIRQKSIQLLGFKLTPHDIRKLLPTEAVKRGKLPATVKALLGDSEKVAYDVYVDVKNADQTQDVTDLYGAIESHAKTRFPQRKGGKK